MLLQKEEEKKEKKRRYNNVKSSKGTTIKIHTKILLLLFPLGLGMPVPLKVIGPKRSSRLSELGSFFFSLYV